MFKKENKNNIHTKRDWFVGIIFFFLSFVVVILCNVYVFRKINAGTFMSTVNNEVVTETIQKKSIQKAVEIINNKKIIVELIIEEGHTVEDPSL